MTSMALHISVSGNPAPKGSVHAYAARNKAGTYTGGIGLRPDSSGYPAWHEAVRAECQRTIQATSSGPMAGPLRVDLTIRFSRPRSHYRTGKYSHLLRDDAPAWPFEGAAAKDIDKLQRAIFDGMQDGGVIQNDKQICMLGTIMRVFCCGDETPGVEIWVGSAPPRPPHFRIFS
jgi:Holliday junction resolvase RusA-like endonuclease